MNFLRKRLRALQAEADKLLDVQPLSVMMKEKVLCQWQQARLDEPGPLLLAGPHKARLDCLYVSRDGESKTEVNKLDRNRTGATAGRVTTLALAQYFQRRKYAQRQQRLIRVWFFRQGYTHESQLGNAQMITGHNGGKGRCWLLLCT